MQVRKFEARTMKEALDLVKSEMGPDAIILSARDNNKRFGLVGSGSIEITAAISQELLEKKRYAESKMRTSDRDRMSRSSAKMHKQFIEESVDNYQNSMAPRPAPSEKRGGITVRKYIDIEEETTSYAEFEEIQEEPLKQTKSQNALGFVEKVKFRNLDQPKASDPKESLSSAVGRKVSAAYASINSPAPAQERAPTLAPVIAKDLTEVNDLKNQIESLKKVISQFNQMPQTMVTRHPGADYGLSFELSPMFEKLTSSGVAAEIAADILVLAQKEMDPIKLKNKAFVDGWTAQYILSSTKVIDEKNRPQFQAFVGPTGCGKTSTIIKMASDLIINEKKKIALVTADTFKVGAFDQMKIYAQILNIPFAIVRQAKDWQKISSVFHDYDYVLIDSPGMSLKNLGEADLLSSLMPSYKSNLNTHLVLPATLKDSDATDFGNRYKALNYNDVIFTCLDEGNQHGTIYNFMKRFNTPLHSFGLGSKIPDDYEYATKERVLDLIFKLTKVKKS